MGIAQERAGAAKQFAPEAHNQQLFARKVTTTSPLNRGLFHGVDHGK